MPTSTNTTIATCVQIRSGDIARSLVRVALALALLATSATPALAGPVRARAAGASSLLGGVNVTFNAAAPAEGERQIRLAGEMHARVVRVNIAWAQFAPARGALAPGPLAALDAFVEDASRHGVGVVLTVDATPCWDSSAPRRLLDACVPGRLAAANAWPPRTPAAYASFVAALARRYGSRLAAIEIWNEPDQVNQKYFAGPRKPQRYARLLRAAYRAIKRAEPSVPVLGGSIVGDNGSFLRALYRAGIKGYYDGLSVHFYTLTVAALHEIHQVQLAHHDRTRLWLDEFGWGTCRLGGHAEQGLPCVTPQVQAQNLRNTVRTLAATPYMAAAIAYTLQDSPREQFGALTQQGARKPAFGALAEAFSEPLGATEPVRLALTSSDGRILARGSAPVGDYMGLEASVHGVPRYRSVFTLNSLNRFSLKLPASLGASGVTVRVFRYWSSPSAAAEASS
ncbi:MAG TPA: cellulase family glycosylhydrolase [Solirubrobacteraceae bacterium]|nr:cellulase family glycosylhydrolase [Solirubrobacteraceae bacterium]